MKHILFTGLLALGTILTACDRSFEPAPSENSTNSSGARQTTNQLLGDSKIYLLTKREPDQSITYESLLTGRIKKVVHGENMYTEYTYVDTPGNKSILSARYSLSQLREIINYKLTDAGLCYHADKTSYLYDAKGGTTPYDTVVIHSNFGYDAAGRLYNIYNTEDQTYPNSAGTGNLHHYYKFNQNGDLAEVKSFSNGKLYQIASLWYTSLNRSEIPDRLQLNETQAYYPDAYLKIFGKVSNSLLREFDLEHIINNGNGTITVKQYKYDYLLNAAGYVMLKQNYNSRFSQQLPSSLYEYTTIPGK